MRDTHEGMPELVAAFERDAQYFASVRVTLAGDTRDIEFGVPAEEYRALHRILQTRPFDQLPGLRYRYFIVPSIARRGEDAAAIHVRIEQGGSGRQFPFGIPLSLARNLYWFAQLTEFSAAAHLQVTPVAAQEA
jgi:hypothetical protein